MLLAPSRNTEAGAETRQAAGGHVVSAGHSLREGAGQGAGSMPRRAQGTWAMGGRCALAAFFVFFRN